MKAGFARLDITPPLGSYLSGYFFERIADGIITPLEAHAVACSDGENTAVAISLDLIGLKQPQMDEIRNRIAKRNNIPYEAVFLACTHTHLAPEVSKGRLFPISPEYNAYLFKRICDAATLAIADMKEATFEIARGKAEDIAFIRRYRMKDGSTKTNPPAGSPDIVAPIGSADETVRLLKIKREGAPDIAIVNFQVHPDVIAGTKLCADFPGFVRSTLENALADEDGGLGVKVIYFNGPQGDTNHYNPFNPRRGLPHSIHMGRVIAGAVLSVYSYTEPIKADKVSFGQMSINVPTNKGTPEEVAEAKAYMKKVDESDDDSIKRGQHITVLGEMSRIISLADAPDERELYLTGVAFGDFILMGFPGEPFTEVIRILEAGSPFAMTMACCCANGYEGYYPMKDAFEEGGYEARSSHYKLGIAETLAEANVSLAKDIKNKQ